MKADLFQRVGPKQNETRIHYSLSSTEQVYGFLLLKMTQNSHIFFILALHARKYFPNHFFPHDYKNLVSLVSIVFSHKEF